MQIDLFEQIKSVLIQRGWRYYRDEGMWTTEKTLTFGSVAITNEALVSIMNTDSPGLIGLVFTYMLKKPDVLKDIFDLLPDSFFNGSRIRA